MDPNEKLRIAFQTECVEHLEAVRTSLAKLEEEGAENAVSELQEAFRHAHSLKGAARITGATAIERIAHQLESLSSHLESGRLGLDKDVIALLHKALDAIEDCAVCLAQNQEVEHVHTILAELDQLQHKAESAANDASSSNLAAKLRQAFNEEYQDYLIGIRAFLDRLSEHGESPEKNWLDEAFRCAHSLKGAARVANVPGVDCLARELERLFLHMGRGQVTSSREFIECVQWALQIIEECATAPLPAASQIWEEVVVALQSLTTDDRQSPYGAEGIPAAELIVTPAQHSSPTALSETAAPLEMVRLSAANLDHLLTTTGELAADLVKQDRLYQQLKELCQQVVALEAQWRSFKRLSARTRQDQSAFESHRTQHGVDLLERQLHSLAKHARHVTLQQQRNAWSLSLLGQQLQRDVQRTRTIPAESVMQGFRKMMRDLARDEGKEIEFRVNGFDVQADRMVLQELKDPVMHVLRNAVTHGIESREERQRRGKPVSGSVSLTFRADGSRLLVMIAEDGRGLDLASIADHAVRRGLISPEDAANMPATDLIRLLFEPGFSTARILNELSGRGMGLSVVDQAVKRLQGDVQLRQRDGGGTELAISVPLTVSTLRVLLVSCRGQAFAIPVHSIESLHRIDSGNIESIEGNSMITLDGKLTSLATLAQLLDMQEADEVRHAEKLSIVVFRSGRRRVAVIVDALLSERDALIKKLGAPADCVNKFSGGLLLDDGTVALLVNAPELVQDLRSLQHTSNILRPKAPNLERARTILVVDDSFTTRTLETSILETHGYRVRVAVDGLEALDVLHSERIDLVITDIQMPRLDGFGLLEQIKRDKQLAQIPVIIVSSVDQREDQQRGLNLGADAYIVKRKFDHQDLLQTIQQIL